MQALAQSQDLPSLGVLCDYLELEPFTAQEEHFVTLLLQGMSLEVAREQTAVGPRKARKLIADPRYKAIAEYCEAYLSHGELVTREKLTAMLMDAHRHASNALEEVAVVRELGKLHGLYESDRIAAKKAHVHLHAHRGAEASSAVEMANAEAARKRLEQLSDSELLAMIGADTDLAPRRLAYDEAEVVEGEWSEE